MRFAPQDETQLITLHDFGYDLYDVPLDSTASNIKQIVQRWLPVVTLRLQAPGGNTRFANDLNGSFFHEFGHTQHYLKAGNSYWASYIWYVVVNGMVRGRRAEWDASR